MREPAEITESIQRAAAFLERAQLPDGSFESFSSPTRRPFKHTRTYLTTFTPALILQAIVASEHSGLMPLREKLAAWLLNQRSPNWSFNYWATAAPERAILPYPDDLDDTFCALIALHQHQPTLIDATCLGKMVNLLIATEDKVGGPYRTWLVGPKAPPIWRDVDLAVNANIAYFLRRVAEPLPNLEIFMEESIAKNALHSPYYPSVYPLIYYLARSYTGQHTQVLVKNLLDNQRGNAWSNPLDTALAVTSLIQLRETKLCEPAITKLLAWQKPDGSWPASTFCNDPRVKDQRYFSGCPALTTALAIEAIARYQNTRTPKTPRTRSYRSRPATVRRAILEHAAAELGSLAPELCHSALAMLKKMAAKSATDEIVLLPSYYNKSLKKPLPETELFVNLGIANLFGWMAYTIFDDYLDEQTTAALLPVASLALRRSLAGFRQALPGHESFQKLVDSTFDTIDGANAWELTHCRFKKTQQTLTLGHLPDYGAAKQLAERSLGHMLTPFGVLAAAGHNLTGQNAQDMEQIFRYYLIARQLGDDMHDWEADVRAGHISYVATHILRDLDLSPGKQTLSELIPLMKRHFWHNAAGEISQTILGHTARARALIDQNSLLTNQNYLTATLDRVDQVATRTLAEQAKARAFLAAYQNPVAHPKSLR